MLNIPEYKEYGGETKIALMDNSSLAFMHERIRFDSDTKVGNGRN